MAGGDHRAREQADEDVRSEVNRYGFESRWFTDIARILSSADACVTVQPRSPVARRGHLRPPTAWVTPAAKRCVKISVLGRVHNPVHRYSSAREQNKLMMIGPKLRASQGRSFLSLAPVFALL
ncbi:hypothetical protein EVAR_9831_1 [Eumeta japonica]|uniref:Uncharacterized protein n=1 Tax=Eumeta variegata TaxID=151549 RepID=A0A4C1U5L5_EUMVA|nr:hypothetical protein EVAR_9831_1 [Eumeta japonica]